MYIMNSRKYNFNKEFNNSNNFNLHDRHISFKYKYKKITKKSYPLYTLNKIHCLNNLYIEIDILKNKIIIKLLIHIELF